MNLGEYGPHIAAGTASVLAYLARKVLDRADAKRRPPHTGPASRDQAWLDLVQSLRTQLTDARTECDQWREKYHVERHAHNKTKYTNDLAAELKRRMDDDADDDAPLAPQDVPPPGGAE